VLDGRANTKPADLTARALAGDPRARARLFTLVENNAPGADAVLAELAARAGRALVVGVTGPPGAGKSTLVSRLAVALRGSGETVAILAVDPASPISGGAVLGDRIRMQELHGDAGAYVRSLSTRGATGGLARAVDDLVVVADGLGFDVVIVETVGAGQDEADVAAVAPTVVVVEVPNLGDDVQSIKAGILEIASIFVVNKADLPNADQAAATLRAMLSLAHGRDAWNPPVLKCSAASGDGVPRLIEAIRQHHEFLRASGTLAKWPIDRARRRVLDGVRDRILATIRDRVSSDDIIRLAADVARHTITLDQAIDCLLQVIFEDPVTLAGPR
jgi:LAO/AO transport system kinase